MVAVCIIPLQVSRSFEDTWIWWQLWVKRAEFRCAGKSGREGRAGKSETQVFWQFPSWVLPNVLVRLWATALRGKVRGQLLVQCSKFPLSGPSLGSSVL